MNMDSAEKEKGFYGTTVVGERGQVVIPAKAREDYGLEKGDHMLVCGAGENIIVLVKSEHAQEIATHLSRKLKSVNALINKMSAETARDQE